MDIVANKIYKRREIKHLLKICPFCLSKPSLYFQDANIRNSQDNKGSEGFSCSSCALHITWQFNLTISGDIIDEYTLYCIGIDNIQYINKNNQLALYFNNTFVKSIQNNIINLDECKKLLLLS